MYFYAVFKISEKNNEMCLSYIKNKNAHVDKKIGLKNELCFYVQTAVYSNLYCVFYNPP